MKKILLAILIVLCVGGVGFLGYTIFSSKNIVSTEIVGNLKTLYVVGDDFSFGDAKLKVTYKNGNIKMVDLNEKTVDVAYFTTSVETHGVMEITYKSKVMKVDYNVIKTGYHYLSDKTINTMHAGSYSLNETEEIFYIGSGGMLRYYTKSINKWYLNDGKYDISYGYSIVGDTMKIKLGDNKEISAQAEYIQNGTMLLKATIITRNQVDPEIVITKTEKVYKHYNTNELRFNNIIELDYSKVTDINYGGKKVIYFKVNDDFDTSLNKNLLLKVRYIDQDPNFPIREAYVYICNEIVNGTIVTERVTSGGVDTAYCFYEGERFYIHYIVEN